MATRNWRQALGDAGEAAGATAEAVRAATLLEAVASGAGGDAAGAAAALRAVVAALDGAARSRRGSWDAAALAAGRAGLRVLPRLIEELEVGASASAVAERLEDLAAAAAGPAGDGEATAAGWRCPRCGSRHVDEQHTDGLSGRYVELLCEACGFYGGFDAGAADEATWRG